METLQFDKAHTDIQNIIEDVQRQKTWNTDQAIRYIVVKISRLVQRDCNFFFSSIENKLQQLEIKTYQKDYPFIICKTLHELIRDILQEIGISSKVVQATNTTIPLYALIVEGEKQKYFIDALYDLFRTQYCIAPRTYGFHIKSNNSILDYHKEGLEDLPSDFIKEIDSELGLFSCKHFLSQDFITKWGIDTNNEIYFSDILQKIRQKFLNKKECSLFFGTQRGNDQKSLLQTKINYISQNLINLFSINGPLERLGLYIYLLTTLFDRSERKAWQVLNQNGEGYPI